MIDVKKPLSKGRIVATPGALDVLEAEEQSATDLLQRHFDGDWGDLCEEDKQLNDEALKDGSRLLSAYVLPKTGEKLWIISEAEGDNGERYATTILQPSEY